MTPPRDSTLEAIGQRLRIAREALGKSTRQIAGTLSLQGHPISHATLGNYERGLTHPPQHVLEAITNLYGRPLKWFVGTGRILQTIRYRALKAVKVQERKDFAHRAQLWLELYLHVETLLGRQLRCKHTDFTVPRDETGRALAERLRQKYNLGTYPIPSTIQILHDFRIYVIELPTDARIDAFAAWFGDLRVIVLNADLPSDRARLNALHELAHHLYEDCIDGPSLAHEEIEKRAFEFASHFLLAEDQLENAFNLRSMVRLVQYKERFGISLAAMIYRAKQSSLIGPRLYTRLWRDFGRLGYRKKEPGYVRPDRAIRMEGLIDAAISDKLITYEAIGELTGTDAQQVRARVFASMGATLDSTDRNEERTNIDFQSHRKHIL